jgi:hypothetical protein
MGADNYSEDALALAFAEHHAGKIAFAANSPVRTDQRWHVHVEDGWQPDRKLLVPWLIRQFCMKTRERCGDPEIVARLSSREMFADIEVLCRCDPRLCKTREELGFPVKAKAKGKKIETMRGD